MLIMLKRGWVPLVVIAVLALGGLGVVRLRSAFGSDQIFSWSGNGSEPIASTHTKHVTYQVFGAHNATGRVSYLNTETQSQDASFASLPWTYTMTTTKPAVIANLVAQADTDGIGCRIVVNGVVQDEQFATGHHAQAFCLVKAA